MARLYFVRHGRAAATFTEDYDPGLDEMGRRQAIAAADRLESLGPLPIISSPLKRCHETSAPLSQRWDAAPTIAQEVAELPSPMKDLQERGAWIRNLMQGTWRDADSAVLDLWRKSVIDRVKAIDQDTVVFSHFVAINVIVGHIMDDDAVVVFAPDNCSVTVLETDGEQLSLIEKGSEADTAVG
jgi:broad specificity phosphatase PhoE